MSVYCYILFQISNYQHSHEQSLVRSYILCISYLALLYAVFRACSLLFYKHETTARSRTYYVFYFVY